MTLLSSDMSIRYQARGLGIYTFPFKVLHVNDLFIYHVAPDGSRRTLAMDTEYLVTINPVVDGGHIELKVDILSGAIIISRELAVIQPTEWENNDVLDMTLLEKAFDRVVMLIQQTALRALVQDPSNVWRGAWVQGETYAQGQNVYTPDGNVYSALVNHTATDLANDLAAGYWLKILDIASLVSSAGDTYMVKENGPGDTPVYVGTIMPRVPVGMIMTFMPGHYNDNANSGYVPGMTNTAAAVNALLNPEGWWVCDGSQLRVPGSKYFDAPNRYLPNLINRMVTGGTAAGIVGGANTTADHQHGVPIPAVYTGTYAPGTTGATALAVAHIPPHTHATPVSVWTAQNVAAGKAIKGVHTAWTASNSGHGCYGYGHTHPLAAHDHVTTATTSTSAASGGHDNRPAFLTAFPVIKVK